MTMFARLHLRRRLRRITQLSRAATGAALVVASVPAAAHAQSAAPAPRLPGAPVRGVLTKPPELVESTPAEYPAEELANRREATVILHVAISATGTVDDARVVESAGAAFDAAALAAVRAFKFSPAEIDQKPAAVKITYRYRFTPPPPEKKSGTFRGVVADKRTGAPLARVVVEVESVGKAVTDDLGQFAFDDVPAGELHVKLSRADLTPLATDETLEAGRALDARYDVELPLDGPAKGSDGDDLEVVVRAPPRLVKQVASTQVSADEGRRVAGTQGDVLKVVENLPGVARATPGSGQLVVWGAAPQDTRTYVGAVRLPMLYHFGGLRSVIHNDRVASVELIPGAYGAPYGRGLGGLVLVGWKEMPEDAPHGSVQLDVLDASAAVAAPIGERLRFAVSARRSHVRELSGALADQSFQDFFTLPDYHDGQARGRYDLAPGESVELGGLLSGDKQSRTRPSDDPSRRESESRTLSFERYDIAYRKQMSGAEVTVAPWYGRDRSGRAGDFGGVPTRTENESHLVGFRSEWRGHVASSLSGRVGFDFELVRSSSERSGSITSPPREGDPYVFGRPPADAISFDQWKTTIASAAPYGEVDWGLLEDRLHVVPGIRFEPYFISVDRKNAHDPNVPDIGAYYQDIAIQPRLAARYALSRRVTFKGATGIYRQAPLPEDLSATFGNPALGLAYGKHAVGGAEFRLLPDVSVDAALFHTVSDDLVARNPSLLPRSGEALVQGGEGRSVGTQIMLRKVKNGGRLFGWLAYTIQRSERKDPGTDRYRLFDYDQTHVLTAVASYDLGAGFEVGLRARVASGFPRTPVVGAYYDARRNAYEPVLGVVNTSRIPTFVQIDARIAKRFKIGFSELEVYLDVQNVTDRDNPEEIAYSPTYSERRYVLGLPILPVAGARWSF